MTFLKILGTALNFIIKLIAFSFLGTTRLNTGGDSILSQIQYKYVRESDNLPVAATIFFDINEFEKLSSTGLAGTFRPLVFCHPIPSLLYR